MKEDMDKDAVVIKARVCSQNYIRDNDVTKDFLKQLKNFANEKENIAKQKKKKSKLFRFTYTRISGLDQIFEVIDRGVMTSYGVKMKDIMEELGIDAMDGYEKGSSVVLRNPNKSIIDMKIIDENKLKE
jgi:hypothetical protein